MDSVSVDRCPKARSYGQVFQFVSAAGALVGMVSAAGLAHGAETRTALRVVKSHATGVASFVSAKDGGAMDVPSAVAGAAPAPMDFFVRYGRVFGITNPAAELVQKDAIVDFLGQTHTTFEQTYRGIPVLGGVLKVHADGQGRVRSVNGNFIPGIKLNPNPSINALRAEAIAVAHVQPQFPTRAVVGAQTELIVYRPNLLRNLPGPNHLVYRVEVGNGADVREFVFVNAYTGKVLGQITGIHQAVDRIVYDQGFGGAFTVWTEGDATPFGDPDIDHLIDYTLDAYNLFASLSNGTFLSWNGTDAILHAVNNSPALNCPNASWNGAYTQFCLGVTSDDVVAHEWAHAYTESTHNLIYQWQSGALNESYSDIFGEIVDLLNGDGTDTPDLVRLPGECSTLGPATPATLSVVSPASIAGFYSAGGAAFNPPPPFSVTADVEPVNDGDNEAGAGTVTDGCQPLIAFTSGRIALIDRGACAFTTKVSNAAAAGAVGVIVVNNAGNGILTMAGAGTLSIPSVFLGQGNGDIIKTELLSGPVAATIERSAPPAVASIRWLVGEDSTAFGGPIRDMWNPNCNGDAGKVSDESFYHCGPADSDNGGVHSNSGIPNHGFALLVDGGTYNGQTISALGLTKTTHIYWRAQSVYQNPVSNFFDHAESLEASCNDLIGAALTELSTTSPTPVASAEVITGSDCNQVAKMTLALELRDAPTFCGFTPLLDPASQPLCSGITEDLIGSEDFESGLGAWTVGTRNVSNAPTFDTPDWAVVGSLPDGVLGSAAFVADPLFGDCGADDETGVLFLESPGFVLHANATAPRLVFDHWVSTEFGWDGGNVKISVNDGPWMLIPGAAFAFNSYNASLNTFGMGNTNPLSGEEAFTGSNGGSTAGSWGTSLADLAAFAGPFDAVRFRFEMGMDGCNGALGWYVDNVRLVNCSTCTQDTDCDDFTICTRDECLASACAHTPNIYGDLNGSGEVTVFDLFCMLDALNNVFTNCSLAQVDLTGAAGDCAPNGQVTVFDLFALLDALSAIDPCCGGLP